MSCHRSVRSAAMALAIVFAATACSVGGSGEEANVTVTHGAVTPTAMVPGGPDGIGTLRTFHAEVVADSGATGFFDATMITTAVDESAGTETRITTIVVALNDGADQLILEGSAVYPVAGSTVVVDTTVVRPVIGGSGAYAGARGWAESTRLADDSWAHVFHLEP